MNRIKGARTNQGSPIRLHLAEYTTELVLILVSLGLLLFARLTSQMINGETSSFDRDILLWFRNPADLSDPLGPAMLEVVVRDLTALGGMLVLTLLCLCACGYLWLRGRQKLATFLLVSVSLGMLLNTLLKDVISRSRPDLVPHVTDAALSSFPSGHAMMSTIVYLTLGALLSLSTDDGRIKAYILGWSILLPLLIGVSRIYLGVHWPTDIIAGWIAGATWSLVCLFVYDQLIADSRYSRDSDSP